MTKNFYTKLKKRLINKEITFKQFIKSFTFTTIHYIFSNGFKNIPNMTKEAVKAIKEADKGAV